MVRRDWSRFYQVGITGVALLFGRGVNLEPIFFWLNGMTGPSDIAAQVEAAVIPLLERQGFELVLLEYVPRQKVLRLFIDQPNGVTIDDCSKVSRLVGDLLDAEGVSERIEGHYNLEVSSPGLDRPLVKAKDFQRFVGKRVNIQTREMVQNRKKFPNGELLAADEEGVRVKVDNVTYDVAYGMIDKARLIPDL